MTDRTTARIVGVLFIVASVTAIVGGTLLLPASEADYLVKVPNHEGRMVTGALLEVALAMAAIGIAAMLFPILKRRDEGLAVSFVGARTLEAVFILVSTISLLSVLTLSRDYGHTGGVAVEPLGDTLVAARVWSYGLAMLGFSVSAMLLNAMLFRAKLVPNWLSILGFVGGLMFLVRSALEMYGQEFTPVMMGVSTAPIGISEMILAGWLIIKGFTPAKGTTLPS